MKRTRTKVLRAALSLALALALLPLSGIAAFAAEAPFAQKGAASALTAEDLSTILSTKDLETRLKDIDISERRLRPSLSDVILFSGSFESGVVVTSNTDYPGVDVPYQATFTLLDDEADKVTMSCSLQYYTKKDGMDYSDGNTDGMTAKSIYDYKKGMYQTGYSVVGDSINYELSKVKDGVWQITVPLHSGVFYYGYNVTKNGDTVTVLDPANPPLTNIDNGHDCGWSVLVVGEPETTLPGQEYTLDADESGQIFFDTYKAVDDTYQPLGIYLPPGYSKTETYPTLYLSHGGGGTEADWLDIGRAGAIFDNLIAEGEVEPTIVVTMDSTYFGWNYDNLRANLFEHIIPYIEDGYGADPSPRRRAFAGLSMGGLLASNIIVNCPEEFGYYGVFSATNMGSMSEEAMDALLKADPFIMMGYGIMDFGKGGFPSAANLFNENGFDNYYNIEVGGAHDWGVWRELLSIFAKDYLWVRELEGLSVTESPDKTVYTEGESFDPAGMKVTASYSDGTTADVTDEISFSPSGKLAKTDKKVTVSYTEDGITKTAGIEVTVNEKAAVLKSIKIEKQPAKTEYNEGEKFDKTGLKVTAEYDNGKTADVSDKVKFNPTTEDALTADVKEIVVLYSEGEILRNAKLEIKVSEKKSHPFIDVPEGSYFEEAVNWAFNAKPQITDGNGKDLFMPYQNCTRGQVVTFLWRTMGCPEPTTKTNPFTDVTKDDYFYKPVLWAVEKGITDGTSATTFSPYAQCKNSHILTFIWRTLGKPGGETEGAQWWEDAEKWARKEGLLKETYTDWFDINDLCPRCNVVTFLYRALVKS